MELSYSIDSWDRLTECKSNKSSEYYIVVRDINCGSYMRSKMIHVHHSKLGCVFATTVGAIGTIVDPSVPDMTRDEILKQLKRFGFNVKFSQKIDIPQSQLYKLRGLYDMGYDRIREVSIVESSKQAYGYIVAFRSGMNELDDWYNNWYSPSKKEFDSAICSGDAYVIKDTYRPSSDNSDWSWVHGVVYRLSDVLSMYQSELYAIERRNLSEHEGERSGGLETHEAGQFLMNRFCGGE